MGNNAIALGNNSLTNGSSAISLGDNAKYLAEVVLLLGKMHHKENGAKNFQLKTRLALQVV